MKRPARGFVGAVATTLGLLSFPTLAQGTQSAVQIQCYGGQNKMGLYLCACDQTVISGLSALVMGGSTPLTGPMTQAQCTAWSNAMNRGDSAQPAKPPLLGGRAEPPRASSAPPPGTSTAATNPNTLSPSSLWGTTQAPNPNDSAGSPTLPSSAGACAQAFNACQSGGGNDCVEAFNRCERAAVHSNRELAVQEGVLDSRTALQWAALSNPASGAATPDTNPSDRRTLTIFARVANADTASFHANPSSQFTMNPHEFEGKLFNIRSPFTVRITLGNNGNVFFAGNTQGSAPVTVDNLLIICVDDACYSAGIRPGNLRTTSGAEVRQLGSAHGFTLQPQQLNITALLKPGVQSTVTVHALDFGVVGGVSDVVLIASGDTAVSRVRPKLPDITYQPMNLGLPGNRHGAGSR